MGTPVRVLIVEDQPDDAELVVLELRRAGLEAHSLRVDTEADYLRQLSAMPDVVLADYRLPDFSALRALELLQGRGYDIPFIVVSGTIGDEAAVECLRRGATDYLLKDRLARLGPSIERALEEAALRRAKHAAEEELRRANAELERRVAERTAELERLIEELAAFNYAVSHDLRSPLHVISSLGELLSEQYAAVLDEQGRAYLARIAASSWDMARLIESFLRLARLMRVDAVRELVDCSAIARSVTRELQQQEPARNVTLTIADGLVAQGDAQLLRIVLVNLLGNAWKYTRPKPEAHIEVGSSTRDGVRVYFVRDNGVGFDPALADRLFLPFQRLHPDEEFEGSGVGLTTVERIVRRHGGEIWAEGQPQRGSTFYFTLASSDSSQRQGLAAA